MKLAVFTNDKEDIIRAIEAYREALKIRTAEEYPAKYAMLKKLVGDAYYQLSFKEDMENSLMKALDEYQKFLETESEGWRIEYEEDTYQEVRNKVDAIKRKMGGST